MSSPTLELAGEPMELHGRALFWRRGGVLFVADLHFGKSAAFRGLGLAAPEMIRIDLQRLDRLRQVTGARELVILGDFFHARGGRSPAVLEELDLWCQRQGSWGLTLVRGNHDHWAGDPPPRWQIRCVDEPHRVGPFICRHYPEPCEAGYVLAGHVHPAVRLRDRHGATLKAACFQLGPAMGILPAFGTFTGTELIVPRSRDRIFLVHEDEVLEWPHKQPRAS